MKKLPFYLAAMLLCFTACNKEVKTETTVTDGNGTATEAVTTTELSKPVDQATMQKAWQAYMTPGEMHKKMAEDVGTWDDELTYWMSPDDKNPTKSKSTSTITMMLNGLYQQSVTKGTAMGQPFEGINTLAYDNAAEEYVSTWVDNMGSGIAVTRGKYDPAIKGINFKGEMMDPVTKKPKKIRQTKEIIDANTQKMEMYDTTADGKEYKCMEVLSKRKK